MNRISLPGIQWRISNALYSKTLLVLGGMPPSEEWLYSVSSQFQRIIAVDHGVEACYKSTVYPDEIVGDQDSASPECWDWALRNGAVEYRFPRMKNTTDFQLALEIVAANMEEEYNGVFLTGCFGNRLDHLLSNVYSLLYWEAHIIPLGMADHKQGLFVLSDQMGYVDLYFYTIPEALSVIPFSEHCEGFFIDGVQWPLNNANLTAKKLWTISNEVLRVPDNPQNKSIVRVCCDKGQAGIYWYW